MEIIICNVHIVMKKGYIQSPRQQIFWGEEKRKILITPSGTDVSLSEGRYFKSGKFYDLIQYAILKKDWNRYHTKCKYLFFIAFH